MLQVKTTTVALLTLVVSMSAYAANPEQISGPIRYGDGNGNFYQETLLTGNRWDPAQQPWNGRQTASGSRIDNTVITSTFPYTNEDDEPVTREMVNHYWDEIYEGYSREGSTASTDKNCHGHSTDKGYWINDMGAILDDEYQEDSSHEADIIVWSTEEQDNHSVRIETAWYCLIADQQEYERIRSFSETFAESAVYQLEAFSHPFLGPIDPDSHPLFGGVEGVDGAVYKEN